MQGITYLTSFFTSMGSQGPAGPNPVQTRWVFGGCKDFWIGIPIMGRNKPYNKGYVVYPPIQPKQPEFFHCSFPFAFCIHPNIASPGSFQHFPRSLKSQPTKLHHPVTLEQLWAVHLKLQLKGLTPHEILTAIPKMTPYLPRKYFWTKPHHFWYVW